MNATDADPGGYRSAKAIHARAAETHGRAAELHQESANLHEEHASEMHGQGLPKSAQRAERIADRERALANHEVVGNEWLVGRSRDARLRAAEAQEAAERAHKRVAELKTRRRMGPIGLAEAAERRLVAEERLAQVEASLAEARRRSVNAHERAARLDDRIGRVEDAQRHYAAADADRRLIEDAAVNVVPRRDQPASS
jgi:hypothetical protein